MPIQGAILFEPSTFLRGRSAGGDPAPGAGQDPKALHQSAMQFEALLVTEILKEVREASSGGWLSGDGDSSGAAMTEIAESQLAQALSSGAGFGLAKSIEQQLTPLATKIPKGPFVVAKP